MKVNKLLLLLLSITVANLIGKDKDSIIGVWVGSAIANGVTLYTVSTFNGDGTLTIQDTSSIEQPVPGFQGFSGGYGTVFSGTWEKVGKRCYKIIASSLLNTKNVNVRNSCGDLVFAGMPFSRTRLEAELKLSKDCQTFESEKVTVSFYKPEDVTFEGQQVVNPLLLPATSQRLS